MSMDIVTLIFLVFDIVTLLLYLWDKVCAVAKWRRIPERVLLTLSILGGIGAILAMVMAAHKIRKRRFVVICTLACLAQTAYLFYVALTH